MNKNFDFKSVTRSFIMLNTMMENEGNSSHCWYHWSWSQENNLNVRKTIASIFHRSIQHDESSGYTFYN